MFAGAVQESIKTKHPQLLYESKLYRVLQGGSTFRPTDRFACIGSGLVHHRAAVVQVASPLSDGSASRATTT